jgi:hypothetical protein
MVTKYKKKLTGISSYDVEATLSGENWANFRGSSS